MSRDARGLLRCRSVVLRRRSGTVFKTVAFVRSAILPNAIYLRRCIDAAANPSARALLP
jgi:hypothetical protein